MNMEIDQGQPSTSMSSETCRDMDMVAELLERPFSARNIGEQKLIVRMLRPTPKLAIKTRDRSIQESWYSRKDWLCGSRGKGRLFCWPCLLFCPGKSSTWAFTGYANMHSFSCDCQKHEKVKSHMEAYKQWKVFDRDGHEGVDVMFSRPRREEVERYNKEVRQNREMLKNSGEAVLYLAKQELAFRGHDESSTSLNQGNYRELLRCFGKLDSVFECRLHGRLQEAET